MKNVIACIFTLSLIVSNLAHADDATNNILKHPIVATLFTLMQDKHQQKCIAPTENDIHWACTGAIPSIIDKPTLLKSGCGFNVSFVCESETANIYGESVGYSIIMPDGSTIDSTWGTDSVSNQIQISNITINKTKGN